MAAHVESYAHQTLTFLFPKNCFDELVIHFNIFHEECSKLVLSRILGLGIILGSVLVKVPQIIKILAAKSGVGVSCLSQMCELMAATATIGYSYARQFPFSSWGEALFLALQTSIIVALILFYEGKGVLSVLFLVVYSTALWFLVSGLIPLQALTVIQSMNIPITISAKLIQALENYRNQSTGQLSGITVFLMFAGSLARIFTSYQETGDQLVILIFVISSLMNGIVLTQLFIYWDKQPRRKVE